MDRDVIFHFYNTRALICHKMVTDLLDWDLLVFEWNFLIIRPILFVTI